MAVLSYEKSLCLASCYKQFFAHLWLLCNGVCYRVYVIETPKTTRVWRIPDVPGLELLRANQLVSGFPREIHEAFSIGLIERGGEIYQHREGRDVASMDDISFVNPLEPHSSVAATPDGFSYRAFQPDPAWLGALCEQLGVPSMAFKQPVVRDAVLVKRLLELHRDFERPTSSLELAERVQNAFVELLRRYGDAKLELGLKLESQGVRVAREYLEANVERNVTLEELARVADISSFHLSKMFARVYGVPPHAYQTSKRVERAKTLLREGFDAAQVAITVGFFDQSHLNRHFKRLVGVSSAVYQRETHR
jgi:AraC-like DNA-binding protein